MIKGSCLCQKVKFTISGTPNSLSYCHCSRCRKSSGIHAAYLIGDIQDFILESGAEDIRHYSPEAPWKSARSFCKHCGTSIGGLETNSPIYVISASALDTDPGIQPMAHIYAASKPDWYEIKDDLKQFSEEYMADE